MLAFDELPMPLGFGTLASSVSRDLQYALQEPRSVIAALRAGFRPLELFPDVAKRYCSRELFPVFQRRVFPIKPPCLSIPKKTF